MQNKPKTKKMDIAHSVTRAVLDVDPNVDVNLVLCEYLDMESINGNILLVCSMYVQDNNYWQLYFIKSVLRNTNMISCDVILAMVQPSLYFVYIATKGECKNIRLQPHVCSAVRGTECATMVSYFSAFKDTIQSMFHLFNQNPKTKNG